MKTMTYKEFKKKYITENIKLEGDGIVNILRDIRNYKEGFDIIFICKKCGCRDIIINGEDGIDYGKETGYCEGTNVIKCKGCGNAITIWK